MIGSRGNSVLTFILIHLLSLEAEAKASWYVISLRTECDHQYQTHLETVAERKPRNKTLF